MRVIPCPSCGKDREARHIRHPDRPCRACRGRERRTLAQLREDARIDWAAVEWVIQGHAKVLTTRERQLALRRLGPRMIDANSGDNRHIPPGRFTAEQLGQRMGCTGTALWRTWRRLPPAERRRCPKCRGPMFVLTDGVVEEHGDGFHNRCGMSGRRMPPAPRGMAAIPPDLYRWAETG